MVHRAVSWSFRMKANPIKSKVHRRRGMRRPLRTPTHRWIVIPSKTLEQVNEASSSLENSCALSKNNLSISWIWLFIGNSNSSFLSQLFNCIHWANVCAFLSFSRFLSCIVQSDVLANSISYVEWLFFFLPFLPVCLCICMFGKQWTRSLFFFFFVLFVSCFFKLSSDVYCFMPVTCWRSVEGYLNRNQWIEQYSCAVPVCSSCFFSFWKNSTGDENWYHHRLVVLPFLLLLPFLSFCVFPVLWTLPVFVLLSCITSSI